MTNLAEVAKKANEELVKNSIIIANIKNDKLRGMLYDLAEEGPIFNDYQKATTYIGK